MEASGKSTLVHALGVRLQESGAACVLTREPGGTALGDRLRAIFIEPGRAIDPLAEVLLLNASRAQLVVEVVRPALAAGSWVLTDRFATATLAYQGYGRGLDLVMLREIAAAATGGIEPDLVLLVDVPVAVSRARVRARAVERDLAIDRLEREGDAFHERVRSGYLALAEGDRRMHVLDGTLTPAALLDAAWSLIS